MSKLPKHRSLMIESLELLLSGNKDAAKKKLANAKSEVNKFYNNKKSK